MSVSARLAAVRGRYSNVRKRMTKWNRTTGRARVGRCIRAGRLDSNRIEGFRVDVRSSSAHADSSEPEHSDGGSMRIRSTVRPSSCVLPSSCARPALIASRSSVTGSSGKRNRQRVERLSVFGGTNLSVCCVSNVPPSSDAVPLEQTSARGSSVFGIRWETFRRTRYLCGGVWSIQISLGPRVTVHAGSVEVDVTSHFSCRIVPAGGVSAASALREEPGRVAPRSGEDECHGCGD